MESTNQNPGVDTLTLQLKESIKYELLKRENKALKEEVARLRADLKKAKASFSIINAFKY